MLRDFIIHYIYLNSHIDFNLIKRKLKMTILLYPIDDYMALTLKML
jgi:hypothetical protein